MSEAAEHSLTNHPPIDPFITSLFESVRVPFKEAYTAVELLCPPSRERSLALTNVEQALMWAIKSIAVNQDQVMEATK